uniref:Uncharacterized protein n=1 Tax=Pithovirus LCPAC101 TaxID=2506586 RepID=A0A481Z2A0_9VIRU|nr:MAG: hypothetical protein LCPAC101_01450 [Pithovirus LCPAC101]
MSNGDTDRNSSRGVHIFAGICGIVDLGDNLRGDMDLGDLGENLCGDTDLGDLCGDMDLDPDIGLVESKYNI